MSYKSLCLLRMACLAAIVGAGATQSSEASADTPEAAAMFERLILRIPADAHPTEIHEYVGKPFEYSLHTQNAHNEETAMTGFIVSGRLYAIHCTRTSRPVMTVYRVSALRSGYTPITEDGDRSSRLSEPERTDRVSSFKTRWSTKGEKTPGLAQVADMYAVIDGRAPDAKLPFTYSVIHSTSPGDLNHRITTP